MTEKKFITIENKGKRDFVITKTLGFGKNKGKEVRLKAGSVQEIPVKEAERLLKLYPLELKNLNDVVNTSKNENDEELMNDLINKDKELKKVSKEVQKKDGLIAKMKAQIEKLKGKDKKEEDNNDK